MNVVIPSEFTWPPLLTCTLQVGARVIFPHVTCRIQASHTCCVCVHMHMHTITGNLLRVWAPHMSRNAQHSLPLLMFLYLPRPSSPLPSLWKAEESWQLMYECGVPIQWTRTTKNCWEAILNAYAYLLLTINKNKWNVEKTCDALFQTHVGDRVLSLSLFFKIYFNWRLITL